MKRFTILFSCILVLAAGALWVSQATADGRQTFRARLRGFQEVPSISTTAFGEFRAKLNRQRDTVTYELTFNDLQAPVLFSHIHLAATASNGGIMTFLCGGQTKPACPQSGTVNGTITAADITGAGGAGLPAQGISPEEFEEFLRALRSGFTYVNVHSQLFPGGEIRGQINSEDDD